jgi:N-acyl-D-amino-acid deacylase
MHLLLHILGILCFGSVLSAHDLVITNATILDGTGSDAVKGSLGITDGRISAIGEVSTEGAEVVDAEGRYVTPGFIDVHTHSEQVCDLPEAENFIRMGLTTIITGNCGSSRTDLAVFFKEMEAARLTLNVGSLIGHNSVRNKAMGGMFRREPNEEQLTEMKRMVRQAMLDGAVGLSTGLIYLPGTFARTDEIVALAKVAAANDGVYASHIRYESYRIMEAVEEFLTVAREAKIPAELSHIKLSGPSAWGKTTEVLSALDKARASGMEITHDQYVYTASSTSLGQLIPDDAREGGRDAFKARLDDPKQKAEIVSDMKQILSRSGRKSYDYAVIAQYKHNTAWNGLSVPAVTQKVRNSVSLDDQIEVVLDIERHGGASAVFHGMNEDDLRSFLKHPLTMIASDGNPRKLGDAVPHPRSYGNNARLLGRYVRDEKILTLPDAIRRMTSLPAKTFHLKDRGTLAVGSHADIVIFDLAKVTDPSQFDDPHHYATGFTDVIVNGEPVIRSGKLTDKRPGGPLRK